jgi:hypothetical protein
VTFGTQVDIVPGAFTLAQVFAGLATDNSRLVGWCFDYSNSRAAHGTAVTVPLALSW